MVTYTTVFETEMALDEATQRAEAAGGKLLVSGRYHRLPKAIDDDYKVDTKALGSGATGEVKLATCKHDGRKYAVKPISLAAVSQKKREWIASEIEIFLQVDHPHIVRLVDAYESRLQLFLVMECMAGGELLDRVTRKRFWEKDAIEAVYQMLLAVNYLHQNRIAHRDLKLQNVLYESPQSDHLKLIDFGVSHIWDPDTMMQASCGTLAYMAPEVLQKHYTTQCDMWSMGVIAWILLVGYPPFDGSRETQMKCIKEGAYEWKKRKWFMVSPDGADFVLSLLKVDPKERLTAEQALSHAWLKKRTSEASSGIPDESICTALQTFAKQSKFKRACLLMMAWSLSNEEQKEVRDAFVAMDTDCTGTINLSALRDLLRDHFELPDENIKQIVDALDSNDDDELNYSEFLAAVLSTRIAMHNGLLMSTFNRFDKDGSGYITVANLRKVLGESFDGATVDQLVKEADTEGDGQISYQEFIAFLKKEHITTLIDDKQRSSEECLKHESPLQIRARTKKFLRGLQDRLGDEPALA